MIREAAALYQQKKYDNAESICRDLIKNDPDNSSAYHLLGVINYERKAFNDAVPFLKKAVELAPNNVDVYVALGSCYEQLNQLDSAIYYFETAYKLHPIQTNLLIHACQLLRKSSESNKAIIKLKDYLLQNHDDVAALFELIQNYLLQKKYLPAKELVNKLQELDKNNPEFMNTFGLIEAGLGNPKAAIEYYKSAIKLAPKQLHYKLNLASILQDSGDFSSARIMYEDIIVSNNLHQKHKNLLQRVHYNLALIELGYGNFSQAWKHLKKRPKKTDTPIDVSLLSNKNILIVGEEGLGDELMFMRFIAEIKTPNNQITYLTSGKLQTIATQLPFIDRIITHTNSSSTHDCCISMMDLPILLGANDARSIPPPIRLQNLSAEEDPALQPAKKPIIGLSWRAGHQDGIKSRNKYLQKEIPLQVIKEILSDFEGTVVILQRTPEQKELEELYNSLQHITFINASQQNDDLSSLLTTLNQLDNYIGVSNTNMHLYASLGKSACVLVPFPGEWRWMYESNSSPWYPEFKIIRQKTKNSWTTVIAEAKCFLNNPNSTTSNIHSQEKEKTTSWIKTITLDNCIEKSQLAIQDQQTDAIKQIIKQLRHLEQNTYKHEFAITTLLLQAGYNREAIECYQMIVEKHGENQHILGNLGLAFDNIGETEQAINLIKKALQIAPNNDTILNNLGKILTDTHKFTEARYYLDEALKLSPNNVNININYGHLMEKLGDYQSAFQFYTTAEKFESKKNALLNYNIGNIHHIFSNINLSTKYYQRCLNIDPHYADAEFNLGINELLCGDFENGWRHYFKRIRLYDKKTPLTAITPGMSLSNKRISFCASQGIGDEIFFLRFLPMIKNRFKNTFVSYQASEKSYDILKNIREIDQLVRKNEATPKSDYYFEIDDIALLLNINHAQQIPSPIKLPADIKHLQKLKELLSNFPKPYIGVAWQAGSDSKENNLKSNQRFLSKKFPLNDLIDITNQTKGTIILIQRNPNKVELESFKQKSSNLVIDMCDMNDSLLDMQALLGLLDDYIGVSSTNVHLLAALNKPGKILLPSPPEWRWQRNGDRSPWMPDFSTYRQHKDGDWNNAINNLKKDLHQAEPETLTPNQEST